MTLQAALEEQEIKNLFKTLENKEVNIWTVIDRLVTGIEILLDMMIIALQNKRESNQEDPSSRDNSVTPPLNKGKAKSNKLQV